MLKLKGYVFNPFEIPQPVLNYALRKLVKDAGGEWRYNARTERKGRWHYFINEPFIEGLETEKFCVPNERHLFYTDEKGELIMTTIDPGMNFELDDDNTFFQSTAGLDDWDSSPRNYTSAELYIADVDYDDKLNPTHQTLEIRIRLYADGIGHYTARLGLYSAVVLLRNVGIFDWRRLEVSDFCYARQLLNSLLLSPGDIGFAPYYGHPENSTQNTLIYPVNGSKTKFVFQRVNSIGNIEAINLLNELAEKGLVDVSLNEREWDCLLANCPPCPVEYNPQAAGNYNAIPQKPWYVKFNDAILRAANYLDI